MKAFRVVRPNVEPEWESRFAWWPTMLWYRRGDPLAADRVIYRGWMWLEHYVQKGDFALPIALAVELKIINGGVL